MGKAGLSGFSERLPEQTEDLVNTLADCPSCRSGSAESGKILILVRLHGILVAFGVYNPQQKQACLKLGKHDAWAKRSGLGPLTGIRLWPLVPQYKVLAELRRENWKDATRSFDQVLLRPDLVSVEFYASGVRKLTISEGILDAKPGTLGYGSFAVHAAKTNWISNPWWPF